MRPFEVEEDGDEAWMEMVHDDRIMPREGRKLLRDFDTGNGHTKVYCLPDGGYQYIIKNTAGRNCALLITSHDFAHCELALAGSPADRHFGLYDAIMLAYGMRGALDNTLLVHASTILYQGKAYPFTAKSGTGKSTHAALWMRYISGATLLNDDNPIIRIIDGQPIVFGSPWSGKTPCYRNRQAPLGALTLICRDTDDHTECLRPTDALVALLPACTTMRWDEKLFDHTIQTITQIITTTPIYAMHCRPDRQAAEVCHDAITKLRHNG